MDIRAIEKNNLSGAGEIFVNAGRVFVDELVRSEDAQTGITLESVRNTGLRIIRSQPRMAPLFNLVNAVVIACERAGEEFLPVVRRQVEEYLESYRLAVEKMTEACRPVLKNGQTICTYSRSSQVVRILSSLHGADLRFSVVLTESRPNDEGRRAAVEFDEAGIPVTLMVDAALSAALSMSDVAVIGADSFSSSAVVNKIGSSSLALHCRSAGKPLYALASCHKLLPQTVHLPRETGHPPEEVWPDAPQGIRIWNEYFETVPLEYFNGVITEKGLLDRHAVAGLEESIKISLWLVRQFGAAE